ncbi:hypothetical protein CRE_21688 [Caenorhabditis remanei]|uniref:Uncharacterized protein n=1 Tax=Caenorhabditis remanei TaxID=31234 RepID=E3NT46_CAERE|nr:hypothetical protein CRE_21688 [Caenorhabditis remanei]
MAVRLLTSHSLSPPIFIVMADKELPSMDKTFGSSPRRKRLDAQQAGMPFLGRAALASPERVKEDKPPSLHTWECNCGDSGSGEESYDQHMAQHMKQSEQEERQKRAGEVMDAVNAAREDAGAEEEARKKARRDEERQAFQLKREMPAEERYKAKKVKVMKGCEEELEKQKRDAEQEEDDDEPGPSNRFAPERERLVGGTSSDDETPPESDQESQEPLRTFETNGIRET